MNRSRLAVIIVSLTLLFISPWFSIAAQDSLIAIKNTTLVNPGTQPQTSQTIIIRGENISRIGQTGDVEIPDQAKVIEGQGKYVIPGLTDTHVHFFQSGGLYTRPDILDLRDRVPYSKERQRIKRDLPETFRRYLRSGITAVADVGGPMWNFDVRQKAKNTPKAPLVTVAGPLISSYQPAALSTDDPPIINPQTPDSARKLVRAQVNKGTNYIKIWYIVRSGEKPSDHLDMVKATIEEAHEHNKPVLVHATELATARTAVKAGADILVHSITDTVVTDSFIQLLKEKNVIYTPTLTVFESYPEVFSQQIDLTLQEHRWADPAVISSLFDLSEIPDDALPAFVQNAMESKKSVSTDPQALKNLKLLHEAGVTIAAGTDAGNIGTPHGPAIYREFELMRKAGLTNAEILKTATINGAKFMGKEQEMGSIAPGKTANLVILNSNPLQDIKNAGDIYRVLKDGNSFKPESLLNNDPADIVQRQVNAYNARDVDAFAYFYSDTVKIFSHPKQLRYRGKKTLRDQYRKMFQQNVRLHAEIKKRITIGNHILDRERVTGLAGKQPINAVAHYIVKNGKIQEVYFIR